jgi:hypothetical protein
LAQPGLDRAQAANEARVMPPRKQREYREACRLRSEHGTPYKRIASQLGISVATAYAWTSDIELTEEQLHRNLFGPRGPRSRQHTARIVEGIIRTHRERRLAAQEEGRARARTQEPLHQAGCMLYWAEGTKGRNSIAFANSDLQMVVFFVRFLRESLGVRDEDITLRLNVYLTNGISLREIEDHWLWALHLPRSSLRKHMTNHHPTSSSGNKRHKLPYGVCTVRVRRSTHLVQHIYGAIQEYGGFEESRWLDGPPRKKRGT